MPQVTIGGAERSRISSVEENRSPSDDSMRARVVAVEGISCQVKVVRISDQLPVIWQSVISCQRLAFPGVKSQVWTPVIKVQA